MVRQRERTEELSETCVRFCEIWLHIEREWGAGDESPALEFVSGDPVRLIFGGFGGNRISGTSLLRVSRQLGTEVNREAVPASGIPYERVGKALSGAQRPAQGAKPPSAGGGVLVFSSSSGSRMLLPLPSSSDVIKSI